MPLVEEDALEAQIQRLKARGFVTTWHQELLQIGWKVETVTPENGSEPLVVLTDGAAVVEYPDGWVVRWNTRRADRPFHVTPSLEAAVDLVLSIYEGVARY
jgi:hypothetical protein